MRVLVGQLGRAYNRTELLLLIGKNGGADHCSHEKDRSGDKSMERKDVIWDVLDAVCHVHSRKLRNPNAWAGIDPGGNHVTWPTNEQLENLE